VREHPRPQPLEPAHGVTDRRSPRSRAGDDRGAIVIPSSHAPLLLLLAIAAAAVIAGTAHTAPVPAVLNTTVTCTAPTDGAANPVNYVELDGHMLAEANGGVNAVDRIWVAQQEYAQVYADCKQARTCYENLKKAWAETKEFAGWNDFKVCRNHETSGCIWLGVGWLPGGKLAKAGRLTKDAAKAADEVAATAARSPSTQWGKTIADFKNNRDGWRRVSAHAEEATSKTFQGGLSVEEVFERGGDRLVRHRIHGLNGKILHETYRPDAKFGSP
jgi:hypothetical protein